MNNVKSKNMMKSSLVIIVLVMSMAERVCGMDYSMEDETENNGNDKKDFEEGMFEAIMNCGLGKDFINKLCDVGNPWTVDKGGFCGGICCAKPAGEWFLVGMKETVEVREKLFDILKTVFECKGNFWSVLLTLKKNFSLSDNSVKFFWDNGLSELTASFFTNAVSLRRDKKGGPWRVCSYAPRQIPVQAIINNF